MTSAARASHLRAVGVAPRPREHRGDEEQEQFRSPLGRLRAAGAANHPVLPGEEGPSRAALWGHSFSYPVPLSCSETLQLRGFLFKSSFCWLVITALPQPFLSCSLPVRGPKDCVATLHRIFCPLFGIKDRKSPLGALGSKCVSLHWLLLDETDLCRLDKAYRMRTVNSGLEDSRPE